jgi:hypothetical protein
MNPSKFSKLQSRIVRHVAEIVVAEAGGVAAEGGAIGYSGAEAHPFEEVDFELHAGFGYEEPVFVVVVVMVKVVVVLPVVALVLHREAGAREEVEGQVYGFVGANHIFSDQPKLTVFIAHVAEGVYAVAIGHGNVVGRGSATDAEHKFVVHIPSAIEAGQVCKVTADACELVGEGAVAAGSFSRGLEYGLDLVGAIGCGLGVLSEGRNAQGDEKGKCKGFH